MSDDLTNAELAKLLKRAAAVQPADEQHLVKLLREAATRLATPPGDAVDTFAAAFDDLSRVSKMVLVDGMSDEDAAALRAAWTSAETARAALSSIPERAHGEQMREAITAAVRADREETLRRLDFERLWNCKTGADAKNAIELVMMDIKCRALPLPPAEERT